MRQSIPHVNREQYPDNGGQLKFRTHITRRNASISDRKSPPSIFKNCMLLTKIAHTAFAKCTWHSECLPSTMWSWEKLPLKEEYYYRSTSDSLGMLSESKQTNTSLRCWCAQATVWNSSIRRKRTTRTYRHRNWRSRATCMQENIENIKQMMRFIERG